MKFPFFTIGHSNRSFREFVELLGSANIGLVADIRTIPRSRTNPQFNEVVLPGALAAYDISYEHMAALGGLRGKARGVSLDVNGLWRNQSFHNYADYALSAHFHAGLEHLVEQGRGKHCAMMCSEAVWWRCHRRIVADHLIGRASPFAISWGKLVSSLPASLRAPSSSRTGPSSIRVRIDLMPDRPWTRIEEAKDIVAGGPAGARLGGARRDQIDTRLEPVGGKLRSGRTWMFAVKPMFPMARPPPGSPPQVPGCYAGRSGSCRGRQSMARVKLLA